MALFLNPMGMVVLMEIVWCRWVVFKWTQSSRYRGIHIIFFLFSHKNIYCGYSLVALLMSTHSICFHGEIQWNLCKRSNFETDFKQWLMWKRCLSYKGTCHVILLAKLHDMYLYKTATFPHQPLKSISKVAFLHRFNCNKNISTFWLKNGSYLKLHSYFFLLLHRNIYYM